MKSLIIEDPCSNPQGMFCLTAVLRSDRKERCHFVIRSLTPPQAAGNALAYAVQQERYLVQQRDISPSAG